MRLYGLLVTLPNIFFYAAIQFRLELANGGNTVNEGDDIVINIVAIGNVPEDITFTLSAVENSAEGRATQYRRYGAFLLYLLRSNQGACLPLMSL